MPYLQGQLKYLSYPCLFMKLISVSHLHREEESSANVLRIPESDPFSLMNQEMPPYFRVRKNMLCKLTI